MLAADRVRHVLHFLVNVTDRECVVRAGCLGVVPTLFTDSLVANVSFTQQESGTEQYSVNIRMGLSNPKARVITVIMLCASGLAQILQTGGNGSSDATSLHTHIIHKPSVTGSSSQLLS